MIVFVYLFIYFRYVATELNRIPVPDPTTLSPLDVASTDYNRRSGKEEPTTASQTNVFQNSTSASPLRVTSKTIAALLAKNSAQNVSSLLANNTRRILKGEPVGETRPYMVYLRPSNNESNIDANWICGGVIIHERYILTSAACIEDVKRFYVISGTQTWYTHDEKNIDCINNGAKRAIWKCVPRNYYYDGDEFDNIRWMAGDIAVVKVEENFNFNKRIRGCDFVPQMVSYNNRSEDLEKPKTIASIAGWGTSYAFTNMLRPRTNDNQTSNSEALMEADTILLSLKTCLKRWPERYHHIIKKHMVCSKDGLDSVYMSKVCSDVVNCKELISEESDDDTERRRSGNSGTNETRRAKIVSSGFCENDHGGPLVVGHGKTSVVIGVMSATQTREGSNQCFGPFLYTSVYKYRTLIECAIHKNIATRCREVLRASNTHMVETVMSWRSHPEGPAKSEEDEPTTVKRLYD